MTNRNTWRLFICSWGGSAEGPNADHLHSSTIIAYFLPRLLYLQEQCLGMNILGLGSEVAVHIRLADPLIHTILSSYSHSEQVGDSFRKIALIAWLLLGAALVHT